jgi:hypothetical protein
MVRVKKRYFVVHLQSEKALDAAAKRWPKRTMRVGMGGQLKLGLDNALGNAIKVSLGRRQNGGLIRTNVSMSLRAVVYLGRNSPNSLVFRTISLHVSITFFLCFPELEGILKSW